MKTVKTVMDNDKENQFWALVESIGWPTCDYKKVRMQLLRKYSQKEIEGFRATLSNLYVALDHFIGDRNPAQGGDDSHSDFIHHIIGLGKKAYYENLSNYHMMESRGKKGDYEESFAYCFPDETDREMLKVEYYIKFAKRGAKEYSAFLKLDDKKMLDGKIRDYLNLLIHCFEVGQTGDMEIYRNTLKQKKYLMNAVNKVTKYLEENELELPAKFSRDGVEFCPYLMENYIGDLEDFMAAQGER